MATYINCGCAFQPPSTRRRWSSFARVERNKLRSASPTMLSKLPTTSASRPDGSNARSVDSSSVSAGKPPSGSTASPSAMSIDGTTAAIASRKMIIA